VGATLGFRFRRRARSGPRPEEEWCELIGRFAPGSSFVDVGCMWGVDGAYLFHAIANGASSAVGLDLMAATPVFRARNAELREPVRFVQGDINDPDIERLVGIFDVVFCAGVLYHVPNPLQTLTQLRRLCRRHLILSSATIEELEAPQGAVFLPGLADAERERLTYRTRRRKLGLEAFQAERGYGNWFWLLTPSCLTALLATAGFVVDELRRHRWVTTAVCRPEAIPPS
jgi:SAM-dependent methyltransferase